MTDWVDEFSEPEGKSSGSGKEPTSDTGATLRALAEEHRGTALGALAAEALLLHEDQQRRRSDEAKVAEALDEAAGLDIGQLIEEFEAVKYDPDADPAEVKTLERRLEDAKEVLREQVRVQEVRDDALYLRQVEQQARAEHNIRADHETPDYVLVEVERARAELEELRGFESDPLSLHPVWVEAVSDIAARKRAEVTAQQMRNELTGREYGWDGEAEDARLWLVESLGESVDEGGR